MPYAERKHVVLGPLSSACQETGFPRSIHSVFFTEQSELCMSCTWSIFEGIGIKLGGYIRYGTSQAWLILGHARLNCRSFLPFDLLGSFCTYIYRKTFDQIELVRKLITGFPILIIFWSRSLNFRSFLTSDLSKLLLNEYIAESISDQMEYSF